MRPQNIVTDQENVNELATHIIISIILFINFFFNLFFFFLRKLTHTQVEIEAESSYIGKYLHISINY